MRSASYFLSAALAAAAASNALAGEQVLEFKLVTKPIDYKVTEAANIEGQTVASGKLFGVAVFKDGRIGVKEFVNSADTLKGSGPFYGYSTYTFEDGSITARYTGAVKDGRQRANIRSSLAPVPMRTPRARALSKARRTHSKASTS